MSSPIQIKIDDKTLLFNLNVYGLLCDSPAKNMILNTIQFNGYYGCPYCLNPGCQLGRRHIYTNEIEFTDRTNEDYICHYQIGI